MVMRCLLLLMIAMAGLKAQAADLTVSFTKTETQWGKSLRGKVRYQGKLIHEKADQGINFEAWEQNFYVEPVYAESDSTPQGQEIRVEGFRLFARKQGPITLPSLTFGGTRSKAIPLRFTQPMTRDGRPIQVSFTPQSLHLRRGQALRLQVQLTTSEAHARLHLDPLELPDAQTLEASIEPVRDGLGGQYTHTQAWSVPLNEIGPHRLFPPAIYYRIYGKNAFRFYYPAVTAQVRPLPVYMPLTVPVGAIHLTSKTTDQGWTIEAESLGNLSHGIAELEAGLARAADTHPETLFQESAESIRNDGVYSILRYQAPAPAWSFGFLTTHTLSFQYFDIGSQRLQRVQHPLPPIWNAPTWFLAFLLLALLPLAYFFVRKIGRLSQRLIKHSRLRKAIATAHTPQEIRVLLLRHHGLRNLSEWSKAVAMEPMGQTLNSACFARKHDINIKGLKEELLYSLNLQYALKSC